MCYHLSVPLITYRDQSAYPVPRPPGRISGEQPSSDTIRGISVCKVYPQMMLPSKAVGSYPTFSSFPRKRGSYFLWHYLLLQLTFQHWLKYPAIHRCIALYCPDFPHNWSFDKLRTLSDSPVCSEWQIYFYSVIKPQFNAGSVCCDFIHAVNPF